MWFNGTYQLSCLLHVGALQPAHDGQPQIHLLYHIDQALGDGITPDNATKDIDKDCRNLGITRDKSESRLDGFRCSATTNIQEIGRRTTGELYDIHGRHGQASAIDEAPNITVEFNEVQAMPASS